MRGRGQEMTTGERVAWYRRRRGMPQEVLAGLVGRTADWLSKVENNRIDLDRLSVIRSLAGALDVTLGDLLGEPSIMEWSAETGGQTVPRLREAMLDYRQLSLLSGSDTSCELPALSEVRQELDEVWEAYQASRYGFVVHRLPGLLRRAAMTADGYDGDRHAEAQGYLALAYQVAAVLLTKLGETDLAWIAAERGLQAAQRTDDPVVIGSLFRSVTHALLSTGRYREAKCLTADAASYLQPHLVNPSPSLLSVYGSLFLAGAVAAARDEDRQTVGDFLRHAEESARRVGGDRNHVWTAFGPTNVAVHRVTTAMDFGDVQVAMDLAPRVDTTTLPVERRVRHAMETARAFTQRNRGEEALSILLDAERLAPEQVRHHTLSRQLVQTWLRRGRGKPSFQLVALARRLHVAG